MAAAEPVQKGGDFASAATLKHVVMGEREVESQFSVKRFLASQTFALLAIFALACHEAIAGPASGDNQVRREIIQQSIATYLASGHPCACPYNLARNGSRCGARSATSDQVVRDRSAIHPT
jgi:hypothetical protein